ncbi:MAG: hypothetical protein IPO62_16580 [Saprospiraceae bacterium]|nr:hypothetical protein [Saprospiraceae bacterium]
MEEDCCGNITRKHLTINVVDRVPPTPICRSWTSVSINGKPKSVGQLRPYLC